MTDGIGSVNNCTVGKALHNDQNELQIIFEESFEVFK